MSTDKFTILIIDDEKNIRRTLAMVLESDGYNILEAGSAREARTVLARNEPDAILLDLKLPDVTDLSLLEQIKTDHPRVPVVMISGHGTMTDAVDAVKRGAFDFLEKPLERKRVLDTLRNALEARRLRKKVAKLSGDGAIVGNSPQMAEVRDWIERVAPTDGRVLVLGESGTGKELVARAIHEGSKRASKPMVKVNCAAIPKELVESVLFGHVKGAFTGALKDKIGTFKQAHTGTLFLDEIADMGLEAQAKVLRVLQEGEFEAVGSTKTEKVNVRVIAATHRDLETEIAEGRFRQDLYYRLAVLVLKLPPLCEREGDVAVLADHFLEEFHQTGLPKRVLSTAARQTLDQYKWPGNVRELQNVMERVVILAQGETIEPDDLPPEISSGSHPRLRASTGLSSSGLSSSGLSSSSLSSSGLSSSGLSSSGLSSSGLSGSGVSGSGVSGSVASSGQSGAGVDIPPIGTPLSEVRAEAERRYLEAVLEATGGNVSEAARRIGLERTHLHKKLSALGLK
ncbi:alginate biosynthesis transcriptional regulatory protein AlgB [bacterium BMS3Bbin04]|nr:alginate biosynthesis transcriptional regulatory protein AlgB [bacterium BMS3Bbin04]